MRADHVARLVVAWALWPLLTLGAGCIGYTDTTLPPIVNNDPGSSTTPSGGSTAIGGQPNSGGTAVDASDPCVRAGLPASPTHQQMFDALNSYRVSKGLPKLVYSKVLESAADGHAQDMFKRSFFEHTNPDGDGPLERAQAAGFCRTAAIGENIAWNQPSVSEVQTAWQNSPGHNANMISTHFHYVGMGYYPSANGPYWVQEFGDVFPQ